MSNLELLREKFADRHGDKENSKFFEEYLLKIYERNIKNGIYDNLQNIRATMVQVNKGDATKYLMELYLMTPYRFHSAYQSGTHTIYVLLVEPKYPALILLEPRSSDYYDDTTAVDSLYPRAKEKANARYLGEIFQAKNAKEVAKTLEANEIRFQDPADTKSDFLRNKNFVFSQMSYFTNNIIGYTDSDMNDFDALNLGEKIDLTDEQKADLKKADDAHRHFKLHDLIGGIDHLATRVLCNEREHAILEFLSMTNYYFWGSYDINEQNSSTNICRNPFISYELHSPAKVFTANNTPFYVKTIDNLPSPTEDFVRNFGKRLHHVAYEVMDGTQDDGTKNIDYVVSKLMEENIPFLADIIGECRDFPDLKQIFSKSSPYSFLITEYVQRCHGFQGFFTKTNVAFLTQAAGEDEKLKKASVFD